MFSGVLAQTHIPNLCRVTQDKLTCYSMCICEFVQAHSPNLYAEWPTCDMCCWFIAACDAVASQMSKCNTEN